MLWTRFPRSVRWFVVLTLAIPATLHRSSEGGQSIQTVVPERGIVASDTALRESLGRLPLYFIENQRQLDPRVKYYLPGKVNSAVSRQRWRCRRWYRTRCEHRGHPAPTK
jgi:hypothetical protein